MNLRKYTAVLLAVCLSAAMLTSCGKNSKSDKLVQNAVELYDAGDYQSALDELIKVDENDLKSVKPEIYFFYSGETYYKLGDYENALEAHQKAVEIKEDLFKSWVTIGVCYRKLGDESNALKAYERALEYDPENADSVGLYVSLGSLYISNNKPYTAIDYLERAEEIYPEQPAAHAYLAIAYAMAYEYEKSDEQLVLASAYGYEDIDSVKKQIEIVKNG
ncbi:MAG: tetratricopeptide repeat protein [Oscillospiraceae bacterium]|nr:tetratricopeptide repeat protein [Oscillospiraceae bacterium]